MSCESIYKSQFHLRFVLSQDSNYGYIVARHGRLLLDDFARLVRIGRFCFHLFGSGLIAVASTAATQCGQPITAPTLHRRLLEKDETSTALRTAPPPTLISGSHDANLLQYRVARKCFAVANHTSALRALVNAAANELRQLDLRHMNVH